MILTKNLLEALKSDDLENAKIYLQNGGDANYIIPAEGVAAIHLAVGLGRKALILLLEFGGNPNVRSSEGSTPLHVAATWGDEECVKLLLQSGADPHLRDQDGFRALDVAKVYGHEEVFLYLKYYSLLLLSDDVDTTDKYTRQSLDGNCVEEIYPHESVNYSFDSDDASAMFDSYITSKHPENVYTSIVNKQLCHHLHRGNNILFDVTSPDNPYVDLKADQTPRSKQSDYCNQVSAHHHIRASCDQQKIESKRTFMRSPLPEFQNNFKHNNTLQWVSSHANVYDCNITNNDDTPTRQNASCRHEACTIAKFKSNNLVPKSGSKLDYCVQNGTCSYESLKSRQKFHLHGDNSPRRTPEELNMSAWTPSENLQSSYQRSPQKSCSVDYISHSHSSVNHRCKYFCQNAEISQRTSPRPQKSHSDMSPCRRDTQTTDANCQSKNKISKSGYLSKTYLADNGDGLPRHKDKQTSTCHPKNISARNNSKSWTPSESQLSDVETSETDSTLSDESSIKDTKHIEYCKRKYVKSTDSQIVPRRCLDERQKFVSTRENIDVQPSAFSESSTVNIELCTDSDSNSIYDETISDCFPLCHDSGCMVSLSDIEAENKLVYKLRLTENKRQWLKVNQIVDNEHPSPQLHVTNKNKFQRLPSPDSKINESSCNSEASNSISESVCHDMNTAHLSNTLPSEFNCSGNAASDKHVSQSENCNKRRESDSSCDTFVTCEDDLNQNRTISEEMMTMPQIKSNLVKIANNGDSQLSWLPPHNDCLDESNIFTSDDRSIDRKQAITVRKKTMNQNYNNMSDLSNRMNSFRLEFQEQKNNETSLKDLTDRFQSSTLESSSLEPTLISVATPNTNDSSTHNICRSSTASSILDTGFFGGQRPSIDGSIFSNISVKEYLYRDHERGITLIERHVPSECGNSTGRLSLESATSARSMDSQKTEEYDWKTYIKPKLVASDDQDTDSDAETVKLSKQFSQLSNEEIRTTLQSFGEDPGPVIGSTRQTYLMRLACVSQNPHLVTLSKSGPDYSVELRQAMEGKIDLAEMEDLEIKMVDLFNNSNGRRWREGALKSSFNYLLLDPRVTRNLPRRAKNMCDLDMFCTFVASIFYVGKGKRSRPYTHLYEAISQMQKPKPNVSTKVKQILDIWSDNQGVVSLHIFQNVIPVEAYSREACIIQTIGLNKLTNKKKGDFYGTTSTWSMKIKRKMGVYFLKKALQIFLAEGERQICPPDIKMGQ